MRKFLPVAIAILIVASAAYMVVQKKRHQNQSAERVLHKQRTQPDMGEIVPKGSCARGPQFLRTRRIAQPVMIDLSQKHYKGVAMLYGKSFRNVLHPRQWEQYGHLGTYAADREGNLYLAPMPFISIEPTTFNLQKNIYKLDSKTGKLSLWMHLDDVQPSATNPYGINAITYDCDDGTLWVSAIDKSDYRKEKGRIYHIDPSAKKILQTIGGIDALSMAIVHTDKGKYLLVGSARDNALYALPFAGKVLREEKIRLAALPDANLHIRKIKVKGKDRLELQAIPFSYALIAQTGVQDRIHYYLVQNRQSGEWKIEKSQ